MKFNSRYSIIIFIMAMFTSITFFAMIVRTKLTKAYIKPKIKEHYLVPTDAQSMNELGLCPLFIKKKASLDPEIIEDTIQTLRMENVNEAEIKEKIAEMTFPGREYHIFRNGKFNNKQVDVNVPCMLPLGTFGNWNRTIIQLKGLDQGDLEEEINIPDGLCAGHSLNNAAIMRDYAETGEIKYLKYLNDKNGAVEFLLDLGIKNWLDVKEVRKNLLKMSFDINTTHMSAISTAMLFDSNLTKNPEFEVFFERNEFNAVQKLKEQLRKGLLQDYFAHFLIVGNEEVTQLHGHFFMLAIIKALNEIQYIVIDTFPHGVYHLKEGSHERNRLMFIIQNIEQGSSTISLPNVRMFEYEKSKKELEAEGRVY